MKSEFEIVYTCNITKEKEEVKLEREIEIRNAHKEILIGMAKLKPMTYKQRFMTWWTGEFWPKPIWKD